MTGSSPGGGVERVGLGHSPEDTTIMTESRAAKEPTPMTYIDPILRTAPVTRIAGPHQSTVTIILRAVELGLFTAAEADMMIDRIRAQLTALPVASPITPPVALPSTVADGVRATISGLASNTRTGSPESADEGPYTFGALDPGHPIDEPPRRRS